MKIKNTQQKSQNLIQKWILFVLLVGQCGLIFYFSAQPAEQSGAVSQSITEKIISVLPILSRTISPAQTALIGAAEVWVRKFAHFCIFAVLGVLAFLNGKLHFKRRQAVYALLFCFLYAVSDELHQLATAGRSCEMRDVCIDFCGSVCGVLGMCWLLQIKKRRRKLR